MENKIIKITKDMIPAASDFPSREDIVEQTKQVQINHFKNRIAREKEAVINMIHEAAASGNTRINIPVHQEIGELFVKPLTEAGYKVSTSPRLDHINYTVEWIYTKKVGDN